jgi:hypothetical protein
MKRLPLRQHLMAGCLALVLATSVFTPALALEPSIQTLHFEFPEAQYCNGVLAGTGQTTMDIRITTFFDKAGDPTRLEAVFNVSTFLTSVTNDETISAQRHNLVKVDLQNFVETHYGLDLFINSSAGLIQVNAGTLGFDENGNPFFVNGPHPFFDEDPDVPVCEVLTG